PHQAFTITRQFAQLANLRRRNEARTYQIVRQQIGQPLRVTDIGLVTRERFNVQGIDQDYFERAFKDVEDWLPVDTSAFNRDVSTLRLDQPVTQPQQIIGHRAEGPSFSLTLIAQARDQHLRVHINSTTDRINDLHRTLLSVGRESLQVKKNLLCLLARVRGQMRWCLGEALRSDSATDSWHQGRTIFASALTALILIPLIFSFAVENESSWRALRFKNPYQSCLVRFRSICNCVGGTIWQIVSPSRATQATSEIDIYTKTSIAPHRL